MKGEGGGGEFAASFSSFPYIIPTPAKRAICRNFTIYQLKVVRSQRSAYGYIEYNIDLFWLKSNIF